MERASERELRAEWFAHPMTQQLKRDLEVSVQKAKDMWAAGSFAKADDEFARGQVNAMNQLLADYMAEEGEEVAA